MLHKFIMECKFNLFASRIIKIYSNRILILKYQKGLKAKSLLTIFQTEVTTIPTHFQGQHSLKSLVEHNNVTLEQAPPVQKCL